MNKLFVGAILLALLPLAALRAQEVAPATASEHPATATPVDVKAAVAKPADKSQAKVAAKGAVRPDRLDLETTVVSGNRELPKVLYIVPWKRADLGELPAQPFNTLLDEVLQPVDRDVFKREVKYFHAVAGGVGAKPNAAPADSKPPPVGP